MPESSRHHYSSQQPQANALRRSRTVLWLLASVLGMVMLQLIPQQSAIRKRPGPVRGDVPLSATVLPTELAGWTQSRFIPAPPPETLSPGQYWWVHAWEYHHGNSAAYVALDQLGTDDWHELTGCYRNLDWLIVDRTVDQSGEQDGPCVVTHFRKADSEEHALLVFSMFYDDGTGAIPPGVDVSILNSRNPDRGTLLRFMDRLQSFKTSDNHEEGHERALQCQVFVSGLPSVQDADRDAAIQLHLESRRHFRAAWSEHLKTRAASRE